MDKKAYKQAHYQANRERYLAAMKERRERENFDSKRQQVLRRDDYTCSGCGGRFEESMLTVHHGDRTGRGVLEHNNRDGNLITLCRSCHCKEHHEELLAIRRENSSGRWSLEYAACVECGTTSTPHNGGGRCDNCYARHMRSQPRVRWSRNHDACIHCQKTDFPHSAKGLCSSCWPKLRRQQLKVEKV